MGLHKLGQGEMCGCRNVIIASTKLNATVSTNEHGACCRMTAGHTRDAMQLVSSEAPV